MKLIVFCIVFLISFICSYAEIVRPVQLPHKVVELGGSLDLHNDVYSGDLLLYTEIDFCKYASIYVDGSYRFVSYYFDTMLHDQRHEALNMQVNGLNESIVGVKYFPLKNLGAQVSWQFPPLNDKNEEQFPVLSMQLLAQYLFFKIFNIGYSLEYQAFVERANFRQGDVLGTKASISADVQSWTFSYAFLFRHRIEESRNKNLQKPYQKMDDAYSGYKMRFEIMRKFKVEKIFLSPGFAYELSEGSLFGYETGHRGILFLRVE